MGAPYHQFCPVAKAMELLDERWTLLIVRELLTGSRHFNEIRRGVPTMSPSLLSKRLHSLVRASVLQRTDQGQQVAYALTPAGEELRPVVEALGAWGMRWTGELGDADLDPQLLMWDLHRNVDPRLLPAERTVVLFELPDLPPKKRRWWMVLTRQDVDVCDSDPGFDVAVTVTGPLRQLVSIWRGDLRWTQALRSELVQLQGPEDLRRRVPQWFPASRFAAVSRPETALTG